MIKKPRMKVIAMMKVKMKVMKKVAMIILRQRRRVKAMMKVILMMKVMKKEAMIIMRKRRRVKKMMKVKAIMKAVMMMKALTTEMDCILIGSKKARYRLSKIIRIPVVISTGPTPLL